MTHPFVTPFDGRRVPIAETLQAELLSCGDGKATLRYPVLPEYTNPAGQLQGGMYGVMMDSAMAIACGGLATATMQFSILRPAVAGSFVLVTGETVKSGKSIIYAEAEVRDEAGHLLARGNQSGVPRRKASPSAE
jgi:uncharacterized protein (TIGR00369 family)